MSNSRNHSNNQSSHNHNKEGRVITYVPQSAGEMGTLRRGANYYTNQLGMNFTLVLFLSLVYQCFTAAFIALNGVKTLPVFAKFSPELLPQLLGNIAAALIALVIQGLIIAELAQVVWLRRPDKLKVRLQSDSFWWWFMLLALVITSLVDFLLLFLSVTGTDNLGAAFKTASQNQLTFGTNLLLAILNVLTLLRCASVMRTTTNEEIRQEVEERMIAIAEEILIDAGDAARTKAQQIWQKLSVDPQRLLPIHDAVFELISKQHPELVPADLGGDSWAHDFGGNTFAVLPPDLHRALLNARSKAAQGKGFKTFDDNNNHLWKQQPGDLADMIGYNLESYGRPAFVDVSDLEQEPKFITRPVNFGNLLPTSLQQQPQPPQMIISNTAPASANGAGAGAGSNTTTVQQRLSQLDVASRSKFAAYLMYTVFPTLHGSPFVPLPDTNIFQAFDEIELQWYFREWHKKPLGKEQ